MFSRTDEHRDEVEGLEDEAEVSWRRRGDLRSLSLASGLPLMKTLPEVGLSTRPSC